MAAAYSRRSTARKGRSNQSIAAAYTLCPRLRPACRKNPRGAALGEKSIAERREIRCIQHRPDNEPSVNGSVSEEADTLQSRGRPAPRRYCRPPHAFERVLRPLWTGTMLTALAPAIEQALVASLAKEFSER
jgi:hypothetical protein